MADLIAGLDQREIRLLRDWHTRHQLSLPEGEPLEVILAMRREWLSAGGTLPITEAGIVFTTPKKRR